MTKIQMKPETTVNYITQVLPYDLLVLPYAPLGAISTDDDLLEDRCTSDIIITKFFPLCFKMAEVLRI